MTGVPSSAAITESIPTIPFAWLRERRWFSSKGQTLDALTVMDWGRLPLEQPGVLTIVCAQYASGKEEQYLLPLIVDQAEQLAGVKTPAATSITVDGNRWHVHDAFQFVAFQRLLLELLISGGELQLHSGRVTFSPEPSLEQSPPPLQEIKLVTAEQSNTSVIYDRQAILKCFRRVVAGVNPDVEVSRFLGRAGFEHTPTMFGSITYVANDVEHSLGLLQGFVANRGDAWEHTLEQLNSFLSIAATENGTTEPVKRTGDIARDQLAELQALGQLTGQLHLALASDTDPDFAPRPLSREQIVVWQRAVGEQADGILATLEQRIADLSQEQQAGVRALLAARDKIVDRIATLDSLSDTRMMLTRYHGDYHLGQVLVSERGFLILDFEGEPLRTLAERRAHSSPLKDVAGMLRSLSYAAQTGLRNAQGDAVRLEPWVNAWEQNAREAFLDGYCEVTSGATFVPETSTVFNNALSVFELEKALYELNYELNNRPDWLPIPLRGIQRTL